MGAQTCVKAPALVGVGEDGVGPRNPPELLRCSLRRLGVHAMLLVRVHSQRLPPVCQSRTLLCYSVFPALQ